MTLIEIQQGDFLAAGKWMTSLEQRHAKQTFPLLQDRWPETLVLAASMPHVELRDIAESMLMRTLNEQIRKGDHCGPVQWDRHMSALFGTLQLQQPIHPPTDDSPEAGFTTESRDWIPVAGCDEATRALAMPTNGTNAISLIVVTEDEQTTHSRVWHGNYAHPNIELRYATQAEFNRYGKGRDVSIEFNGVTSESCTSGRLRIVRWGQRMSFMIAEQGSQVFRIIHSADVSDAPVRFDGIRLAAGNWGNPHADSHPVSVLWKRLEICTEPNGT